MDIAGARAQPKTGAPSRTLFLAVTIVQLLAIALWACGLVTLGALVAPIVFHVVPAPGSADAMTLVFRRFDIVAITCAIVALLTEVMFVARGARLMRSDILRGLALVAAAAFAITVGAWLSPSISALHQGGAIRGLGDAGLELERLHRIAESCGKAQLALLLGAFILSVERASRR